jgi:hypothetical protein
VIVVQEKTKTSPLAAEGLSLDCTHTFLSRGARALPFGIGPQHKHTRAQRVSSLKDGCVVDAHYRRRPGDFAVVQSCAQPIKDKVLLIATLSTTAGRVCLQASEPAGASAQLSNTVLHCFASPVGNL